ncbi:MAG: alpha/beta fold hydrolase [Akkermansiaceae bacterium]
MIWALHGAVGMAEDWRAFAAHPDIRELAGEVRRIDLWRFLDCCPMPLEKIAETLAGEICRIDPEPILLGYSMGARLALHALLGQGYHWKAAIIVSAHTGLEEEIERALRREKDAEWSARALKSGWQDFLCQWEAQSVLVGKLELPDRRVLKKRRASIARSFIDWSLGVQADLRPRLKEIPCPVLWITGQRDTKFTEIATRGLSQLSDGKHEIVSDCGHRVPWEKPEEFVQLCREFIESIA